MDAGLARGMARRIRNLIRFLNKVREDKPAPMLSRELCRECIGEIHALIAVYSLS